MRNLIALSVRRPIATGVITALVCAAGLLVWGRIPQEVMPDLSFPQLTIVTEYDQAAPQEIENLVTKPIEEAVGTVKNVREVRSVSKEGASLITVEFWWGTDMEFASLGVREKLDLVKSRLPLGIREPVVVKYNPFAAPVMIISLTGEEGVSLSMLTHMAKRAVANRLQKAEGVAAVDISGDRDEEIRVDLDQNRLAAVGLPLLQFNRELAQANFDGAAGTAKDGSYDYAVRVFTPFATVSDIANAVISVDDPGRRPRGDAREQASADRRQQRAVTGDQRLARVSEVGEVREDLRERTSFSRLDGREAITLMVQKQASASTLRTARNIRAALEDLRRLLPSDVAFTVVYDQAEIIRSSLRDVLFAVLGGGLLAFVALYVFLRSWRNALIVCVVIPASTLTTLVVMHLSGITLNTISLGGLALGVGMLVDAAICVTENIHRRRFELKEDLETAIISGTEEVVAPVVSSNLTSIAVFLPLFFVLGLLGQLFRDLSLTVCISQTVAIVVAVTLVPMLTRVFGGTASAGPPEEFSSPFFLRFRAWYLAKLSWSLLRPRVLLGGVLALFLVSVTALALLPRRFLPAVDTDQIVVKLTMPNGTLLERTNAAAERMEAVIGALPEAAHVTTTVGSSNQSPLRLLDRNEAQILLDLAPRRDRSAERVIAELRGRLDALSIPGGKIEIAKAGGPLSFARAQSSPVMAVLKGVELDRLRAAAAGLGDTLAEVPGLVDVRDSLALPAPEVQLEINKERAARLSLSVSDIAQTAAAAYHGRDVTKVHRDGKEIPVRVRLREQDRRSLSQLRGLLLPTPGGGTIPLSDVAALRIAEAPSQIARIDQERAVIVQADAGPGFTRAARRAAEAALAGFSQPGVTIEEAGEKKIERESFHSLGFVLLIAILLVYGIMAVQFESLTQPLLIMVTIPLALIGVAAGLLLTGQALTAMSAMGFLLLGGIVVNNGIVLISFVNARAGQGEGLTAALTHACRARLRPILVTAVTTCVGLLPLALGIGQGAALQAPMAVTVIFGLAASTALTLVALPAMMILLSRMGRAPQSAPADGIADGGRGGEGRA